jgi:beta-phosphoglucomutase-like phosphatase (HAD superfamily)
LLPKHESCFLFWVCGEDVQCKKPNPAAYRLALERLALPPQHVMALEDSANGLAAAVGAGITTVVTRSGCSATEPPEVFAAAAAEVDHLGDVDRPLQVHCGPACPEGQVTLSYLQQMLPA